MADGISGMPVHRRLQPGLLALLCAWVWVRLGFAREQKCRDGGWSSYAEKVQFKILKFWFGCYSRQQATQLERAAKDLRSARIFGRYSQRPAREGAPAATQDVMFKHSGNAGDIIYALPAIKALCQGRLARLFLKLEVPVNGWSETQHPLGRSGLTWDMVAKLKPLLEHQPWVASVQVHAGETVDYDLDIFRQAPSIRWESGGLSRWYFWLFAVHADLSRAWLELRSPPPASGKIVLARSARYRNPNLDYAFLRELGDIDFVGTRDEYAEMRKCVPQLQHAECADFLQLAGCIQSARFFIGNQSFPYSLAEALKVPRILEVCPECSNVVPAGDRAAEAFFQPHFERLVKEFAGQGAQASISQPGRRLRATPLV